MGERAKGKGMMTEDASIVRRFGWKKGENLTLNHLFFSRHINRPSCWKERSQQPARKQQLLPTPINKNNLNKPPNQPKQSSMETAKNVASAAAEKVKEGAEYVASAFKGEGGAENREKAAEHRGKADANWDQAKSNMEESKQQMKDDFYETKGKAEEKWDQSKDQARAEYYETKGKAEAKKENL